MVRLSKDQEQFLTRLKAAKSDYEKQAAQFEAELRVKKEQARAPLSRLVAEALDAGLPARQVALTGLGYADVSSLKQYLTPVAQSVISVPVQQTAAAMHGTVEPTFTQSQPGSPNYVVTDSYGEEIHGTYRYLGLNAEGVGILQGWDDKWAHGNHDDGEYLNQKFEAFIRERFPNVTDVTWN